MQNECGLQLEKFGFGRILTKKVKTQIFTYLKTFFSELQFKTSLTSVLRLKDTRLLLFFI